MSKSTKIISVIAALAVIGGTAAYLLVDRSAEATSADESATGYYWMAALKADQEAPSHDAFGTSPESSGFCYLSPLPEQQGLFFIIPHPCNSVFRSISLDADGFHSVLPTSLDTTSATVTGRRRADGVYTVTIADQKDVSRFAIRLATASELERLHHPDAR